MGKSDIPENFFKVCSIDDLREYQGKRFFINDVEIALFKINGGVFALSNICPHQHSAVIYEGIIEDDYVVCPVHGWKFSIMTGKQPTGFNGLKSYKVILDNNEVYVEVIKRDFNW